MKPFSPKDLQIKRLQLVSATLSNIASFVKPTDRGPIRPAPKKLQNDESTTKGD
jgi:hypothetical protein